LTEGDRRGAAAATAGSVSPSDDGAGREAAALELAHVTKRYGATVALDDVSLTVAAGSVHALLGENGAGKSTLVKVVNGVARPDSGTIAAFGDDVHLRGPVSARRLNIATAFQEMSLVPDMTVAENLFLGDEPRTAGALVLKSELRERAAAYMDELDIRGIHPDWLVGDLTLPEKQVCETAKALRRRPRLLFLDESTSALGETGMLWFYGLIERLRERGTTIVFITHRLAESRRIADRVSILRNGHQVGTYGIDEVSQADVIRLMIGRSLQAAFPPKRPLVPREPGLEVRGLTREGSLHDVSFELGRGEVLGIAALEGQGQRELFLTLFGMLRPDAGEVCVDGKSVRTRSPRDAIAAHLGISLVPEERKTEGLFLKLPVRTNMALPSYPRLSTGGWIRNALVRREVVRAAKRVGLDPKVLGGEAGALSGGNQQKVVIGKWVLAGARYMLLYDPTRGVDVGTKFDLYTLMHELAESGVSILVYSSELPEVLGLADRVLVMYGSTMVAEFGGADVTEEKVMSEVVGHRETPA